MDTIKWNKTPFYRLMAAMVLGAGTAIAPLVLLMFGLIQFKIMSVVGAEATTSAFGIASGIASLARDRSANELIERLEGIQCGARGTSCPDQLARALEDFLENR